MGRSVSESMMGVEMIGALEAMFVTRGKHKVNTPKHNSDFCNTGHPYRLP